MTVCQSKSPVHPVCFLSTTCWSQRCCIPQSRHPCPPVYLRLFSGLSKQDHCNRPSICTVRLSSRRFSYPLVEALSSTRWKSGIVDFGVTMANAPCWFNAKFLKARFPRESRPGCLIFLLLGQHRSGFDAPADQRVGPSEVGVFTSPLCISVSCRSRIPGKL